MNLPKMFETQKVLRDRIDYNEPDRFNKLVLALMVEAGECANEWKGFKFWSQHQEPVTKKARAPYVDLEDAEFYNPLLEEYVDKLHFILELGIELGVKKIDVWVSHEESITDQYIAIVGKAYEIYHAKVIAKLDVHIVLYECLFGLFIGLGEMFGFSWDEIEEAYYKKNKINHVRQDVGY
jgi:dimeric dUTPase (all-alpha-NTP-PPase superfamily)